MTRNQNRDSRASLSAVSFFAMKSRFDCPSEASSRFAPVEPAESSSCQTTGLKCGSRSITPLSEVDNVDCELE